MKRNQSVALSFCSALLLLIMAVAVAAQTADQPNIASVASGGSAVRWDIGVANNGGTLTITFPDGRSLRQSFKAGTSPQLNIGDKGFESPGDGVYTFELQLAPQISSALKVTLTKARGKDDDPESERASRKRSITSGLVQSGSFAVVNGSIIVAGATESQRRREPKVSRASEPTSMAPFRRLLNHRASFLPDVVTADDEIIQGSLCVGLDCVNNENFGFDTIRVKENNDRIQFDDTSTSAGFPSNNWQIRANSSGSGGGNFLAFVDQGTTGNSETGTIVFEVDAGAPANSLRVSSTGNIGVGTATPVLDVHVNTTDTPAFRLEQNNSGGFTAQTWDIAGNEANFFVRDVTSGSRLPFRIRPGAPTSSIDISSTGNVGINTASPGAPLHVVKSADGAQLVARFQGGDNAGSNDVPFIELLADSATDKGGQIATNPSGVLAFFTNVTTPGTLATEVMRLTETSRVGIGTASPDQTLSVNGDASKAGGGSWQVFSDARLKNIQGRFGRGLDAVMRLRPVRYEYKADNALGLKSPGQHVGFSAQAVQTVIPEAVSSSKDGYLMVNNDPILWTMLNAIQEQQKQIEDLKAEVRTLRNNSRRHRR